MNSSTLAKDTFVKYLSEELVSVIPVKTYTVEQQNLQVNALNIRFLNEKNVIGMSMWEAMVSLDILINNKFSTTNKSERAAAIVADTLIAVLLAGVVKKTWKNNAWSVDGGYITWDTQQPGGVTVKDIPQSAPGDLYMHKNVTMLLQYFT